MPVANTVGIAMPDDFPTNAHNSVHDRLREYRNRNPDDPAWLECAAGWNAVARRFKTMATADEEFAQQIIAEQFGNVQEKALCRTMRCNYRKNTYTLFS